MNNNFEHRVKFLMKYDSKKSLLEQTGPGITSFTPLEPKGKSEVKYPDYCSYPDKAVKGFKNLIKDYCYYPSPAKYSIEKEVVGKWIPSDAEIEFWDLPNLNSFLELVWSKWHDSGKIVGVEKKELIKNFSEIFPLNTVSGFKFSGQTYRTTIIFNKKEYQEDKKWMFKGYFRKGDNLEYEEPVWIDTRTDYQKFIDDWGTWLQIGGVVLTIIVGALSGGAAWALTAEIIFEMGIGIAVGQRELEKGENISAVFSFITGALPMLKLTKWFKGIDPKLFNELAQDFANSTIKNEEEMLSFYNSLSSNPEKQKLFEKIFLQDDVSEEIMEDLVRNLRTVENLNIPPYISTEEIFNLVKSTISNNKEVFKNLKFWDKLWARELSSNVVVGILDITVDATLGRFLNNEERQAIEWVYTKVPDSHKKEFIYNLANNPEVIPSLSEEVKKTRNQTISSAEKYFSTYTKHEIEKNGKTYVELPEDPSKAGDSIPDSQIEKDNLIKNGWVPKNELNGRRFSDAKFVGDELFFKIKTENLNPETPQSKISDSTYQNINNKS